MMMRVAGLCSLGLLSACLLAGAASAQALPPLSVCNTETQAPAGMMKVNCSYRYGASSA